jgi:hypothetical protein
LETVEGILSRAMMLNNGVLADVPPGAGSLRDRYRASMATTPAGPSRHAQ